MRGLSLPVHVLGAFQLLLVPCRQLRENEILLRRKRIYPFLLDKAAYLLFVA
jgi:hypothetical protein